MRLQQKQVYLQFSDMRLLWQFAQQLKCKSIEIRTGTKTLLCDCSDEELRLAVSTYGANCAEEIVFKRLA